LESFQTKHSRRDFHENAVEKAIGDMNSYAIVKGLEVEGYRGLLKAGLTDFAGINIFVGRNGSGKSSLLEALYIALKPHEGLSYVVKRRGWFGLASAEALFHGRSREVKIKASFGDETWEEAIIRRGVPIAEHLDVLKAKGLDVSKLYTLNLSSKGKATGDAVFYVDSSGRFHSILLSLVPIGEEVRVVHNAVFIDWNSVYAYGTPEEVYSTMVKESGEEAKEAVIKTLQAEYEELRDIAVLRTYDEWVLHLTFKDRAIPYYVVGDGIRYALMYLMAVFTPKEAALLMEEPELHTHPRLMKIVANSILHTHRERRNQVFLSTHSLELIEMLLEQAEKLGLKDQDLKIYRIALKNSVLYSKVYTLSEALDAVKKLEWDLRK